MKLVECKAELIQQENGLDGMYKHIETCSRVPYKSEDKSDGTIECAKSFIDKLIKAKHLACMEHGTLYLTIKWWQIFKFLKYLINPYSRVVKFKYITTNYRTLLENGWLKDLQFICTPTKLHKKRYTFKVLTSIGVTREANRHRLSILEQSTRYCNFCKDKFDNQVSFCKPSWLDLNPGIYKTENVNGLHIVGDGYIKKVNNTDADNVFIQTCLATEANYKYLIAEGWPPQKAREVLLLCTATEAVYTGFSDQWGNFFDLRYFESTGKVHPNMLELSTKMVTEAKTNEIWNDILKYCNYGTKE